MSSSKIISQFALAEDKFPVGSDEFVSRFLREREEQSSEGLRLKRMEERHQVELQQAYQNGFVQGEATGLQRGQSEARRVEAQLSNVISELVGYRQRLFEQSKTRLLELALTIANKITEARAVTEKETVLDTITRCIAEILDKTRIKVKVSPGELEFVKTHFDALVKSNEAIAAAVVESDPRVSAGGCIIETDYGSADARLESQMQFLKEKLLALEQ